MLFYRFISENLIAHLDELAHSVGDADFDNWSSARELVAD
jgi:hypothetical protein